MAENALSINELMNYLGRPDIRALVDSCLDRPVAGLALWLQNRCEHPQWVAQQVACLQKAKTKLPAWYKAGCVFLPVPLQQSTSELAAALKADITGATLLDLTCGLGVDAFSFARRFKSVTVLEQDEQLVSLAKHNFRLLQGQNIEILRTRAEDFLASYTGPPFDVIYADPARRESGGQRRFLLQDCSPNILALKEKLTSLASEVWIKVSPLFDLREGLRRLDPVKEVRVIAIEGEVKEVLFCLVKEEHKFVRVSAFFSLKGEIFSFSGEQLPLEPEIVDLNYTKYLLEPDVSLYKAGLEQNYMATVFPELKGGFNLPGGYYLSSQAPHRFPGAVYEVEEAHLYQPEKLRKYLKSQGITKANLTRKVFDVPLERVKEALKIKEGGEVFLLFTRDAAGRRWMLKAKRILLNNGSALEINHL